MSKKRHKCNRRRLRNSIWFRKFGTVSSVPCHWCRKPLLFNEATVDHEPPRCCGGTDQTAVLACYECNQKRNREMQERMKKPETVSQ